MNEDCLFSSGTGTNGIHDLALTSFQRYMAAFLSRLAHTFYYELGKEIADTCFVFPNRRAGLLFKHCLAQEISAPLFAPGILTVDQLFQDMSPLRVADPVDLQLRMYALYTKHYLLPFKKEESFDDFIFWGRMIMSDFNEIDRQLADADALLANLSSLKEIDRRFESDGDDGKNTVRLSAQVFQTCLLPMYKDLNSQLAAEGLAYMGMLQRKLVEGLSAGTISLPLDHPKCFVFVGFNVLTAVERSLMLHLQSLGLADFYFDYEAPWLRDPANRASLVVEQNIAAFKSRFSLPAETPSVPEIHWVKCPSSVNEAEEIARIVGRVETVSQLGDLGIVLPDEHLLQPVLYALPGSVGDINITMGLPLSDTPLYTLVQHLSELQIFTIRQADEMLFYYKPVMGILCHPYVVELFPGWVRDIQAKIYRDNMVYIPSSFFDVHPLLASVMRPFPDTPSLLQALSDMLHSLANSPVDAMPSEENVFMEKQEYIYRTLLIVNRLLTLLNHYPDVTVQPKTAYRLLLQLMQTTTVPFEGEPLQGMQIMGVLEARGMDFRTVIMPDMNEDTYPGDGHQNSFIPYELRLAYGLATPERQDAIASYNFYRLLSHAQTVYLLQTTSEDGRSPDASRYIYQLLYQYNVPLIEENVCLAKTSFRRSDDVVSVSKDDRIMQQLLSRICRRSTQDKKGLSPSALNRYVSCPLRFYLEWVCRFEEPLSMEESVQSNKLGTIFHRTMQQLYSPYAHNDNTRTMITEDIVKGMQEKFRKECLVEHFYAQEFLFTDDLSRLQGRDYLPIRVLQRYVDNVLWHDLRLAQTGTFFYLASEQWVRSELLLPDGKTVRFQGIVDRVDEVNGQLRVVDYKTGKEHAVFPDWNELFSPDRKNNPDHVRQTLVYSLCYSATYNTADIVPCVYYVCNKPDKVEKLIVQDDKEPVPFSAMEAGFRKALSAVLEEILSPDIPFEARPDSSDKGTCANCPFRSLCF